MKKRHLVLSFLVAVSILSSCHTLDADKWTSYLNSSYYPLPYHKALVLDLDGGPAFTAWSAADGDQARDTAMANCKRSGASHCQPIFVDDEREYDYTRLYVNGVQALVGGATAAAGARSGNPGLYQQGIETLSAGLTGKQSGETTSPSPPSISQSAPGDNSLQTPNAEFGSRCIDVFRALLAANLIDGGIAGQEAWRNAAAGGLDNLPIKINDRKCHLIGSKPQAGEHQSRVVQEFALCNGKALELAIAQNSSDSNCMSLEQEALDRVYHGS